MDDLDPAEARLRTAVQAGDRSAAEAALVDGADPGALDAHGWTALHWAAGAGARDIVDLLLGGGADPDVEVGGCTPYDVAIAAGYPDAAAALARRMTADRAWRPYCRAYPAAELRRFAGWREGHEVSDTDDAEILYLHDDLSVTTTAVPGGRPLFDGRVDGWAEYCSSELGFAVPDTLELCERNRRERE